MKTRDIQMALISAGFPVGRAGADDIWGRDSIAALRLYQRAKNLPVTGVLDASTMTSLFPAKPANAPAPLPPWYAEALRLQGTAEIVGPKNNSTIMGWAQKLGLWYPNDEMAWCGLFVAHCISLTLPQEPMPDNPLGARNWLKLGRSLDKPALGAVLVFWRGSKSGIYGHVGFYAGETATAYRVLGGNQNNSVNDDTYLAKGRLLGIRWPKTAAAPVGGPVLVSSSGKPLSTNEA